MFDSFQNQSVLIELKKEERKTLITFITFGIILLLLVANSIYLTFYAKQNKQPNSIVNTIRPTPTPLVTTAAPTTSPTQTALVQSTPAVTQSVKDFFIPFGIGNNQASDWTDIPGSQVTIDFGNYQNINQILFEAAVSIPTANESASVRLFNETDHHPVWYSEVTTTDSVFAASSPIIWDKGTKVYQVQMKTSLSYLANLTLARLHIILN